MSKIKDLWFDFLLFSRLKKMDFRIETIPPCEIGEMACISIVMEPKWFWQKTTEQDCC